MQHERGLFGRITGRPAGEVQIGGSTLSVGGDNDN